MHDHYLLLNGDRELFDLILAMYLCFGCSIFFELLFFLLVDVGDGDGVILTGLPEGFSCLGTMDLVVHLHLLIVVLKITVCHHIVVSLQWVLNSLSTDSLLHSWLRALLGGLEVMVFLIDVANDVIVHNGVLARAEVPRLLLGVVFAVLKALQLVVEVHNIVGLLVTECTVLQKD